MNSKYMLFMHVCVYVWYDYRLYFSYIIQGVSKQIGDFSASPRTGSPKDATQLIISTIDPTLNVIENKTLDVGRKSDGLSDGRTEGIFR